MTTTTLMNAFNDYAIFSQMVKDCGDGIDCQAGVHDFFVEVFDNAGDGIELDPAVVALLDWLDENRYCVADARVHVSFQSNDF